MRNLLSLFVLSSLLLLYSSYPSLSQKVIFNLVAPPEDNPWTLITGITQDPQGFMWFASNQGLNRYDGFKVTHYMHDPSNNNSLANNRVECILADSRGIIWAGTHGYGIDKFDPINNKYTHFRHQPEDETSLINDTVTAILEDREKNIWIGTYGGVEMLDIKTGKLRHYKHNANDSSSLSNNHVRSLYEDRKGTIWVGTGSPFINDKGVVKDEGGLNRLDRKTDKFTHYMHDPKNPQSLVDNRIRAIFEDSRGNFWVGTAGDGLHSMDRDNGIFKRHHYDPANPRMLSRPPVIARFTWVDDHITFITEDVTGALWIGTISGGLNRYDINTEKTTFYYWQNFPGGFNDYDGWSAYSSRDGVLWISSLIGNLFRMDPLHQNFPYYDLKEDVVSGSTVYEDTNGMLWIGVSNGLILTERGQKIKKRYVHDPLNKNSIGDSYVNMILKDPYDKFWISTYGGGFNYFDPETEKFIRYQHDPKNENSLINNTVLVIHQDRELNLWIGTFNGLDKMEPQTGKFVHYQNNPVDTNSLSDNAVRCLLEDRKNQLWVGTGSFGGINTLNRQTGKFKHYLKGTTILCLLEDADGMIWAGTSDGLFLFNPSSGSFTPFVDPNSGIRIKNVLSITEDDQKNLWLFCSTVIIRLNSKRDISKTYGKEFGVKSNLTEFVKSIKSPSGDILCGDQNGFYAFSPGRIIGNSIPPQVVLSDFLLGEQSIKPGKSSPLHVPLSRAKEIRLNYKQNVFSFDFAVLHYSNPENNQHLFMLENYDNTWRNSGTEKKAFYFNVPPGRYIFRVKAANNIGIWTEKSLNIIITPPWWQSWWFLTAVVLFLLLLIYTIIKVRVTSVRKAERLRSKHEKEILELEAKALRSQMNPHFIFNCLNSIKSLIQQHEEEKSVTYLTTFSKLIRTLFNNADKKEISLYDEIETCKLYLQSEAIRFDAKFSYSVNTDENIDFKSILVPALIIQPFIENAIWHGIVPRNTGGNVTLNVFRKNGAVEIVIEDDGIGRETSKQNKSSSGLTHQSKGVNLTQSRLELDNLLQQRQVRLEITDKKDENGKATGTKVILIIYEEI